MGGLLNASFLFRTQARAGMTNPPRERERRSSLGRRRSTIKIRNKTRLPCSLGSTAAVPESRSIRDPIHRFIKLQEHEAEIVDSEVFQRLRNLRQLAFAYLVYPSATHT
jgi:hypothetical protein